MPMLEKIIWESEYKIGLEDIDFQHQYFVSLFNRLIDELIESKEEYYRGRLLEELSLYASFHFISEENRMIRCNYPHLEEHKDLHCKLMNQLNDNINYLKMSKVTQEEVIAFLSEWFIHHTTEHDMNFGIYCNRTNQNVK